MLERSNRPISHINFNKKLSRKRSAGNPHAAFEAAGIGNVAMVTGLRATTKVGELPPEPKASAPVLDPTLWQDMQILIQNNKRRFWMI